MNENSHSPRGRWEEIDQYTKVVIGVAVAFLVVRTLVATQSAYTFHQGWNEGRYSMIGLNFVSNPFVPRDGAELVYNVPPLFPYLVTAAFLMFGVSEVVARFPSILLSSLTIVAAYGLGVATYDDRRVAALGACLLATLPYFQLYGGRAQTDAAMLFFFTAALAAIVYGFRTPSSKWLVVGGLLFGLGTAAKQPVLILPGVVLCWLLGSGRTDTAILRRVGKLILSGGIGLLPLVIWEYYNYLRFPEAFLADWRNELFSRTEYFANVPLNVVIGGGLGMTPLVLGLVGLLMFVGVWRYRIKAIQRAVGDPVVWWVVLYGLFVMIRTPHGHQYYVFGLLPPVVLLASRGFVRASEFLSTLQREHLVRALLVVLFVSTLSGTVVLFELSGEYSLQEGGGERLAPDAAGYLVENTPENTTVVVEVGYLPQMRWYGRGHLRPENVKGLDTGQFSRSDLRSVVTDADGPVYVVYPVPTWGAPPQEYMTEVYRTQPYEFTIMGAVGHFVSTDSEFTYYLNDRRLAIYRVDKSAFSAES